MQIWVIYNNDYPHSCYASEADAEDALKLYRAFEKKLRDEAANSPNHDFRTWINYGIHGPFETSVTKAPRDSLDAREKILWNKVLDENLKSTEQCQDCGTEIIGYHSCQGRGD